MTEAKFSFTTKVGNDLLTVRGDTSQEFIANLDAFALTNLVDKVLTAQAAVTEAGGYTAPAPASPAAPVGTQAAPAYTPSVTTPAPAGGIDVQQDRYGNTWTYGLPDAPQLPDGRGQYVLKQGRSKAGKPYKGWFDPAKGPKPFTPGATEAPAIFGVD